MYLVPNEFSEAIACFSSFVGLSEPILIKIQIHKPKTLHRKISLLVSQNLARVQIDRISTGGPSYEHYSFLRTGESFGTPSNEICCFKRRLNAGALSTPAE